MALKLKCPSCHLILKMRGDKWETAQGEYEIVDKWVTCIPCGGTGGAHCFGIVDSPSSPSSPSSPHRLTVEAISTTSRLPQRQHDDDAGYDLYANEAMTINVGATKLVKCGIKIAIPPGLVGFICPRSGMALKRGVTVLNGPGVIDPGFEDELGVILINLGDRHLDIAIGDRIAQIVFIETAKVALVAGTVGSAGSARHGGFGSSGGFGDAKGQRGNEDRDKIGSSRQ